MSITARCTRRLFTIVVVCLLLTLQGGCAQTAGEMAEEAAEEAAPTAVSQTLAELNEVESRRQLNELLTLPGFAALAESLSRGFVHGILAAIDDRGGPVRLEAISREVTSALEAAVGDLFGPRSRRVALSFADQLTQVIVRAALQVFSEELREELGPALREVLRDEVGPGMAEAIRQHIGPAVAETLREAELREALARGAHTVGKQSVLGVNDAMLELRDGPPDDGLDTPLETLQQAISQGEDTLQTVLWMLGVAVLVLLLLVIALGLGLWRTMARGQEMIEESKVREESLSDMAQAVTAAEERDDISHLFARVAEKMGRDAGSDYLQDKMRQAGLEPPSSDGRDQRPRPRD